MSLFESIIDANHRAVAGDASARLHPADFAKLAFPVLSAYTEFVKERLLP